MRETRTPAFISLHKDLERQVSAVPKEFFDASRRRSFGSHPTKALVNKRRSSSAAAEGVRAVK